MKILRPGTYAAAVYGGLAAFLFALAVWGPIPRGVMGLGLVLLLGSQALMSLGTVLLIVRSDRGGEEDR